MLKLRLTGHCVSHQEEIAIKLILGLPPQNSS